MNHKHMYLHDDDIHFSTIFLLGIIISAVEYKVWDYKWLFATRHETLPAPDYMQLQR